MDYICKFCDCPCTLNENRSYYGYGFGSIDQKVFNCHTCKMDYVMQNNKVAVQTYRIYTQKYSIVIMDFKTNKSMIYFDPKIKSVPDSNIKSLSGPLIMDQIYPDVKPVEVAAFFDRMIKLLVFL
jgi:hypothetical protein